MASKLSLKKKKNNENEASNCDTPKTPIAPISKNKVSASFIFSSCKKKKAPSEDLLPGHTILVGNSSDEEFVDDDPFDGGPLSHHHSTVINESLVEYSLIRKWLQNADSPSSSDDSPTEFSSAHEEVVSDEKPPTSQALNLFSKAKDRTGSIIDDTIVLSSDDDVGASPIICKSLIIPHWIRNFFNISFCYYLAGHQLPLTQRVKQEDKKMTVGESSLSDDSFDSSSAVTSLKDRLVTKEPAVLASDSDDDSLPILKLPNRIRRPLISLSSSSDDEEPVKKPNHQRIKAVVPQKDVDSDLEDLFVGLAVSEVVTVVKPPKKKVQPKPTARKRIEPTIIERPLGPKGRSSFLASLSANLPDEQRHPEALIYLKSFKKNRDDLVQRLFILFNREVFHDQLPRDFSITWNNRLTRTAGYCRHFTRREGAHTTFESKIELSVKVVDTPCRLRDTLIHELCHASTWMLDNCRGGILGAYHFSEVQCDIQPDLIGHGPVWRKWANLALRSFPELPPISRCHNYEIAYKFYYNCTVCSFSTGRHSKSVDTNTHVCPMCRSKLALSTGKFYLKL